MGGSCRCRASGEVTLSDLTGAISRSNRIDCSKPSRDHHPVDSRLRGPLEIVVPVSLPVVDAVARLRRTMEERPQIEATTNAPRSRDRRFVGTVSDATADLSIWDAHLLSRRKGWNIEFHGMFEQTTDGAVLRGTIDIPDRRQLRVIFWLVRLAVGMVALFAIALTVRALALGAAVAIWPAISALAAVPVIVLVTARLETEGEGAAADDAGLLRDFLTQILR